jgi:hypothetical protein
LINSPPDFIVFTALAAAEFVNRHFGGEKKDRAGQTSPEIVMKASE